MSTFYEGEYLVDSRDVDAQDHLRPSAMLGFLQEAATMAAVALHMSRSEAIEKYHAFWMLGRVWYRVERPIHWNEQLRVRTWHRGGRGASTYRDFDLFVGDARVGEAVSLWVLADLDSRKLMRISDVGEFTGTDGGALCKPRLLPKLRTPEGLPLAERRLMHYSDTDINGHVNNARYADFACDALHLERRAAGQFVSALQIGYLSECRPGEQVDLFAGGGFVHGAGAGGEARFDAAVELSGEKEKN